jgi:PhnB protein
MNQLNPYLLFNGDAGKAIQLYEETLGAKTEGVIRFGDGPGCEKIPEKDRSLVMHAMLLVGGGRIMISDCMPDRPVAVGANVQVVLDFDDKAEMTGRFNALAASGKVTMPLADMFWGAHFGTLVDAFGVNWMFNCVIKKD